MLPYVTFSGRFVDMVLTPELFTFIDIQIKLCYNMASFKEFGIMELAHTII